MKRNLPLIAFLLFAILSFSQTKHILLEEFSTAPCGFCPDGDLIAAQLIKDHPNVIWITHHAGFGTDSMTVPESVTIANAFTTFAPGAAIDRGDYKIPVYTMANYIAVSRQKWDSVCVAHLSDPPVVSVGIKNTFNSSTRMYDCLVEATFLTVPASGDIRINVYLVEDSVVGFGKGYDQKNYMNTQVGHPYYQKGDEIVGYVHHHILRKVLGGAWGNAGIIPFTPVAGTKYTKSYSNIAIPSSWREKHMSVVAFVSYNNTNAALRQVINSNEKTFLDASGTGISGATPVTGSINIYPNPASDLITIDGVENGSVRITNISGQHLGTYDISTNKNSISTSSLANGVYFYEISSENKVVSGKLVVIR